jgi:hypothetical protein
MDYIYMQISIQAVAILSPISGNVICTLVNVVSFAEQPALFCPYRNFGYTFLYIKLMVKNCK